MKTLACKWQAASLLLTLVALVLTGCGTVEGDAKNASSRPWNSPNQWETGQFPMGMGMQGR